MWYLKYKSFLEYLDKSKSSEKKKEKLIKKNTLLINYEISKLSEEKLFYYLINSKVNIEVKKEILKYVSKIIKQKSNPKKDEIIIELYKDKYNKSILEDLYSNYGKNPVTILLCNKYFGTFHSFDLVRIIEYSKISIDTKKMILDLKSDDKVLDLLIYLEKNSEKIDKELKNYIIKEMTYSDNDILNVIISSKVSKGMKKEVIKHHINISNVVKVISSTQLYSASDLIYELNPEIIDKYIESLDKEGIIEYYNSVWKTDKLSYEIFKRKNDLLVKIIKNTSEEDLIDLIKKIRYSKFTTLLFKLRREDMHNAIMKLNDPYDIMFILNHDNISNKDKMELINNKREKILSKIKNLRQHDYIAYMRSNLLPDEVKKMMMDECYDNIVECINKIDEESLKLYILSDDFYEPFNELIIKLRVDEVNIISLLKAKYTDNKILEKIIILKNQTLRNMIQKLSLKELMYFKSYILTEDIRNIIIKNNIDIVENLIKKKIILKSQYMNL